MQANQLEQITFRLDTQGAILKMNTEKLRKTYAQSLTKDNNRRTIQDITHIQDLSRLQAHLSDVMQNKSVQSQSLPYRIRFGQDVYVYVKAYSQFYRNIKPNDCGDFIMSINTLLTDNELAGFDATNKTPISLPSTSQVNAHNVGGPLMTSVMNGSGMVSQMQNPISDTNLQQDTQFFSDSFDFQLADGFDMNGMESVGVCWDSRPDSRASVTPVSTPRPPSAFSPIPTVCQSPLTGYHTSQPSPQQV